MFVCICNAVRESDIHQAVKDGACNLRDLARVTGCTTRCGKCAPTVMEVLRNSRGEQAPVLKVVGSGRTA